MKRISFAILALGLTYGALSGCGGSSASIPNNSSGSVNFSGTTGVTTTSTGSGVTVPATGGVTVTTADTGTRGTAIIPSGAVPAGTVIGPGTQLEVIPAGTGFTGKYPAGSALGINGTTDSGAFVTTSGVTTENIALPIAAGATGSSFTVGFPGGSLDTFKPTLARPILTVQSEVLVGRFYVLIINGKPVVVSPVPTAITGTIPNNGQNAVGSSVVAQFGAGNNGRSATLHIDYGNGFVLNKTVTITNNSGQFRDLTRDTSNVPGNGIRLLQFVIGDLP